MPHSRSKATVPRPTRQDHEASSIHQDSQLLNRTKGGRVLLVDSDHETFHDSILASSQEVFAKKGSLVMCAGSVSSKFGVTVN